MGWCKAYASRRLKECWWWLCSVGFEGHFNHSVLTRKEYSVVFILADLEQPGEILSCNTSVHSAFPASLLLCLENIFYVLQCQYFVSITETASRLPMTDRKWLWRHQLGLKYYRLGNELHTVCTFRLAFISFPVSISKTCSLLHFIL